MLVYPSRTATEEATVGRSLDDGEGGSSLLLQITRNESLYCMYLRYSTGCFDKHSYWLNDYYGQGNNTAIILDLTFDKNYL